MRLIVSFCCVLVICSNAIANELVVGEQGSVSITLPNQPNNQKCNIEVKFADGSSQDIEVDPKNLSKSISFTPTIAGTQIIQWDGKMKFRGLKSRPPCAGDGNVSVNVRERAEVLAEREAEAERLRAEQAVETERLKLEAERLKAEREGKARLEQNRQALANLVAQLDTEEKKLCGFEYARTKSTNPQRYEGMDASQWARKLIGSRIVSPNTINEVESALDVCNQFFSKEREWRSQTFEPPTGDISCTLGSGAKSTCYWTYRIYANDAWQDATALQAMEAHITSGEKFWATSLPEKSDAKALREKREADLARERAQECKRNPLSDPSCPGYAAAKEEQEKREAAAEKERQRNYQEQVLPLNHVVTCQPYRETFTTNGKVTSDYKSSLRPHNVLKRDFSRQGEYTLEALYPGTSKVPAENGAKITRELRNNSSYFDSNKTFNIVEFYKVGSGFVQKHWGYFYKESNSSNPGIVYQVSHYGDDKVYGTTFSRCRIQR